MPVDWTNALAHVEGDKQLLAELAAMFVQDCPRLLLEARESIVQADHAKLERSAHTLKGRLAFFGALDLRDKASQLETMGRTGPGSCWPRSRPQSSASFPNSTP